jgi:sulfatase maturation enzyme AslB (radical SAM superfamily)
MANKFCRFLSNGLSLHSYHSTIAAKPCCWFKSSRQFTNSHSLEHLALVTDWIPDCHVCKQQEDSSMHSFRMASFDIVPDTDHTMPVALDINLDFECNAACITCGPQFSSLWTKELKKFNIAHAPAKSVKLQEILKVLDLLDLSQIGRIKFFGGEPLANDVHLEILKKFPCPENIDVWYTTNASIRVKQQVFDTWAKFKLVYFEASIDGVHEQFDYIRWPLKWDRVQDNLFHIREHAPPNVLFRINHTVNPLNVLYYNRLLDWVETKFATNRFTDPTEINVHPCWGTWALTKTPVELREKVYQMYPESYISRLLKNTDIDTDYTAISRFVKQWDPRRNNSWKLAFPEVSEYFKIEQ